MAKYIITSPEGDEYEISAPDDATEEQVMSYAKQQFSQPADTSDQPVDYKLSESLKNFPSDAAKVGADFVNMAKAPEATIEGLGKLSYGGVQAGAQYLKDQLPENISTGVDKVSAALADRMRAGQPEPSGQSLINVLTELGFPDSRIKQVTEPAIDMSSKEVFSGVADHYKGRYGSMDDVKRAAMEHPAETLMDMALPISGIGMASKATLPAKIANPIQKVAAALDPMNVAWNSAKLVGKAVPKSLPRKLYSSAAKFPDSPKRSANIETALKNKISPTMRGSEKLTGLIKTFENRLQGMIHEAEKTGKAIPKQALYTELRALRKEVSLSSEAGKNQRFINRFIKSFDENLKAMGKDSYSPSEMNKFKRKLYDEINYDRQTSSLIKEETKRAMAKGAKKSVERAVPGAKELNAEYGPLLELNKPLRKAAVRNQNAGPSLRSALNVGVGGAVLGPYGAGAGAALSALEKPSVLSNAAFFLESARKQRVIDTLLRNNPALSAARLGAYEAYQPTKENN